MLFNSLEFLFVFLPIVFVVYFSLNKFKKYGFAKFWLLLASLFFYGVYNPEYLWIILSSILFNYLIGLFMLKEHLSFGASKKIVLIFGLIGNLALLCYYKYWNFLIDCFNSLANQHFNTMQLLLPLGISFFTFQQISYIVDCYKGDAKHTNIIDYALFVTFFPQLIAGPIIHHKEIIPQFEDESKKQIIQSNISLGLFLLTIGLVKKVLLADAGYPKGFEMTITVPSNYQAHMDTAQVIVNNLAQIGIKAKIEGIEWTTWLSRVYTQKDYETSVIAFGGKLEPSNILRRYYSTYKRNFVNYKNPAFDKAFDEAFSALTQEEQTAKYKECQKYLAEDAPAVFICDPNNAVLTQKNVKGYVCYPVVFYDLSSYYFE